MKKKTKPIVKNDAKEEEEPRVFAVNLEEGKAKFTRRDFLRVAGAASAATAAAIAACSYELKAAAPPTPTATPTNTPRPTPTVTPTPLPYNCADVKAHTDAVPALVFDQAGKFLASGSEDQTIKIWSMPEGALQTILQPNDRTLCLAFHPDGSLLASGHGNNTVKLWSLPGGYVNKTLNGHDNVVRALAINPKGDLLASGGNDKNIILWSLPGGDTLKTLKGHNALVSALAISPDGSQLASGDGDGVIHIWSLPDGNLVHIIETKEGASKDTDFILALRFSPDGQTLASGNQAGAIQVWTVADGQRKYQVLHSSGRDENTLAFSDDLGLFAIGDKEIAVKSLPDGKLIARLTKYTIGVNSLVFNPDATILASSGDAGSLRLWAVGETKERACLYDSAANPPEVEGVEYQVEVNGQTVTYTLPCGAPIPPGAVCVCNCVASSGCACVGYVTCSCVAYVAPCSCVGYISGGHYWYPN